MTTNIVCSDDNDDDDEEEEATKYICQYANASMVPKKSK